jgi:hypothetical protein
MKQHARQLEAGASWQFHSQALNFGCRTHDRMIARMACCGKGIMCQRSGDRGRRSEVGGRRSEVGGRRGAILGFTPGRGHLTRQRS